MRKKPEAVLWSVLGPERMAALTMAAPLTPSYSALQFPVIDGTSRLNRKKVAAPGSRISDASEGEQQ